MPKDLYFNRLEVWYFEKGLVKTIIKVDHADVYRNRGLVIDYVVGWKFLDESTYEECYEGIPDPRLTPLYAVPLRNREKAVKTARIRWEGRVRVPSYM